MRVLVIGAGAIGQLLGYHFQQGGAELPINCVAWSDADA